MMQKVRTYPSSHISIGVQYYSNLGESKGEPACIPLDALRRHVCILGTTGAGKSTCAAVLCYELAKAGIPTLILDRTGEYVDPLGRAVNALIMTPGENLVAALFQPTGDRHISTQIEEWVSLLDHFSHVSYYAGLSPLQARVLREVFHEHFRGSRDVLTVSRLISKLERYEKRVERLGGWVESIEAIISRLYPLTVDVVGATLDRPYQTFDVEALFEPRTTIVDLSVLPDDRARNLLSQVILKRLYEYVRRRGRTGSLRLVCLIDEAQHLAPSREGYISIPELCAIELRKYGFCLVMCATRPSLLSPNVIANCNTLISLMLNNEWDIERVAGFFINGASKRQLLRRLPVGFALVQVNHPSPREPVLCRVGLEEHVNALGLRASASPSST
jgi:DNA helicase HerA-like ATPase